MYMLSHFRKRGSPARSLTVGNRVRPWALRPRVSTGLPLSSSDWRVRCFYYGQERQRPYPEECGDLKPRLSLLLLFVNLGKFRRGPLHKIVFGWKIRFVVNNGSETGFRGVEIALLPGSISFVQ